MKQSALYGRLARYSIEICNGVICLVDLRAAKSVTNDAENVIRDLFANPTLNPAKQPVIYRDTLGIWDQLVIRDGRFGGFRSLGRATTIAQALAALGGQA